MKTLHRGEVLFRQGEKGPLYRLQRGVLKVVRIQADGTTFLFNLLVPGEVFPHHSLITPKEYHGTAIALMDCEVESISAETWYSNLERHPERYREVASLLENKMRMMQQRIDQLTSVSASERLNRLVAWMSEHFDDVPLLELLTQEEIGQLVGVRRETVNRLIPKAR